MATDPSYAKYVCDQLLAAGGITSLKMFGEYGLYRHGKIVALIADNQLFVKPTPAGAELLASPTYGPPYPGAKPFINASDLLDDPETLVRLIVVTHDALPAAKKRAAKKRVAKERTAKERTAKKGTATKRAAKGEAPKGRAPKRGRR